MFQYSNANQSKDCKGLNCKGLHNSQISVKCDYNYTPTKKLNIESKTKT